MLVLVTTFGGPVAGPASFAASRHLYMRTVRNKATLFVDLHHGLAKHPAAFSCEHVRCLLRFHRVGLLRVSNYPDNSPALTGLLNQ